MFPLRDNIPSRTFPYVTVSLIAVNLLAFIYELSLGEELDRFITTFSIIPAKRAWLPYVTSMFLHGGWMHLIGNMWYLWIFGDNVEDRLGPGKFALFYLASGVASGIVHTALNSTSPFPTLGASGAVAGVLGAYAVSYPRAKVLTLIPIFVFIQFVEVPALIMLGLWFIMQFFGAIGAGAGGVAWWAHIGGFVFGIGLLYALGGKRRGAYDYFT